MGSFSVANPAGCCTCRLQQVSAIVYVHADVSTDPQTTRPDFEKCNVLKTFQDFPGRFLGGLTCAFHNSARL